MYIYIYIYIAFCLYIYIYMNNILTVFFLLLSMSFLLYTIYIYIYIIFIYVIYIRKQAVTHVYLRIQCPVCPSRCNCALRRTYHPRHVYRSVYTQFSFTMRCCAYPIILRVTRAYFSFCWYIRWTYVWFLLCRKTRVLGAQPCKRKIARRRFKSG